MEQPTADPIPVALDFIWHMVRAAVANGKAVPVMALLLTHEADPPYTLVYPLQAEGFEAELRRVVQQDESDVVFLICEAAMIRDRNNRTAPPPEGAFTGPDVMHKVLVHWRTRGSSAIGTQYVDIEPHAGQPRTIGKPESQGTLHVSNRFLDRVFEPADAKLH